MSMSKEEVREWIIALTVVGFSILVLFYLIPTQIGVMEGYDTKSFSPRFYPELITLIIGILGILLVLVRLLPKGRMPPPPSNMMSLVEEVRVVGAFFSAVFFMKMFQYLGFFPGMFLGLTALFTIQGGMKRPLRTILTTMIVSAGVYVFFRYGMKVQFPTGSWLK
ncbi:MAG: tripartite tricarboxylate transporter TctB family protein [Deltaproteobacteria bacterium]|nr:tripartite tricarboxylate transporter TctB family protein [Deltaproteobacteria bacterium]